LYTGDLYVGGPGAALDSANGAVRVQLLTDFSGTSPFPVIEAAVVLAEPGPVDLNFTLDRGRVDVTNVKQRGPAHVRVHVRSATCELTLEEPGASVALELYGRWPRGVPFTPQPGPKHVPTANLVFLVLKGNVSLRHGDFEYAMRAPPGPALMEWDSVSGADSAPERLEKLPSWATVEAANSPEAQARKVIRERFQQALAQKQLPEVIDQFLNSNDERERRLGVAVAGATDDLERLGNTLRNTRHHDVWENGVRVLRHWIGRGPGQDQILYKALLEKGNLSPVQAETIMQLLHSFGDDEVARPELYQTLIAYLNHDVLGIRGLAYWHLSRLAPGGKQFGYNPWDGKEARAAAIQKWKTYIPPGKLPPQAPGAEGK
jgi:hypothetical protein